MKRVYVFLAQGFEEMEALGPVDILRRGGVEVLTVSITDCYEVVGAHGVRVMADRLLGEIDAEGADLLLLPGGMPGATNLLDCRPLHRLLTTHHQNGKLLGAICAAPMVLGQLGLLKGKRATCYPGFEHLLTGATTTNELVTVDGLIVTGKGPAATFDYGFTLLSMLSSEEKSREVAQGMMFC
ncbi:MAG: DJ-1/PfpI family protein [Prevotella sp.]|nr:DJ-1/PfpI family protein [Prevotella sp.]